MWTASHDRLELVLVDSGVTAPAPGLGRDHEIQVRRVGWDDKPPVFRPSWCAWCDEVVHGRLGRSRRLANSFANITASATGWLEVACIANDAAPPVTERTGQRPWRSQSDLGRREPRGPAGRSGRHGSDGF